MHILREIEPEGLPIVVDAIKSEAGEVLSLRLFPVHEDDSGAKRIGEEFPLQENKNENEPNKEEHNE